MKVLVPMAFLLAWMALLLCAAAGLSWLLTEIDTADRWMRP